MVALHVVWGVAGGNPGLRGNVPGSLVAEPRSADMKKAFTLIELLVVMVIAAVIMAVAIPSFLGMGRGAGMRTAVNNVRSTASLARQWSITHREEIIFMVSSTGMIYNVTNGVFSKATNDHACYYAIAVSAGNTSIVQSITDFSMDVTIDNSSATSVVFKTDGGLGGWNCDNRKNAEIILKPKTGTGLQKTIIINWLTGGVSVR